jgi:hypothetical protein
VGINRRLKTPCTILRRVLGEPDEFGNPTYMTKEVEAKCAFQQQRRDEHDEGGELSDTIWNLWLPIGTEVDTGDAVVVKGRKYEVVGEPWEAEEGSRSLWHTECTVERAAGTGDDD